MNLEMEFQLVGKKMTKIIINLFEKKDIDTYIDVYDGFILKLVDFSEVSGSIEISELDELINKLNKNDKEVFININKIIHNNQIEELRALLIKLETYKINGVLFGDLGVLKIYKDNKLSFPLIWNQSHLVTNASTSNYYASKGVVGALLSNELTLDEVISFQGNTELKLMVNIFGLLPMFKSYRSGLTNYFNYFETDKNEGNYFIEDGITKNKYLINEDSGTNIFSSHVLNGLAESKKLLEEGIEYLVINSYFFEAVVIKEIGKIFKERLQIDDDKKIESIEERIKELVSLPLDKGFFYKPTVYQVKDYE